MQCIRYTLRTKMHLQLVAAARFHDTVLLRASILELGLLLTSPLDRLQSLSQDGVGVVVARVEVICIHGRQILDLQLDERLRQFGLVAEVESEVV